MCARAVSVAIKKLPGVTSATVSLNSGTVDVKLADGNKITVVALRDAIRKNGFTPKAANARVEGTIASRGGQLVLDVSGTDVRYVLGARPEDKKLAAELVTLVGHRAVVTGALPESPAGKEPGMIAVLGVAPASSKP